ncbi:MAG: glutamyl-tRNA reductase [Burkholderiales bacterium]|nr:glutamyl-tRNA reductase [Burkholderiales bacterium]
MSRLGVFGVDYRSAGFDIREKLAFTKDEIPRVLHKLRNTGLVDEVVVLSTCNRTEVYFVAKDIDFVINIVGEFKNICPKTVIKKYCYIHTEKNAVYHLFRVVSGLESMVLGETEIVAQTKEAFALSKQHNVVSRQLSGLFQMALAVEKDVRSATEINNIAISMGNAVVNLVAVNCGEIKHTSILFVGAGAMMQNIAPHFKNIQCHKKTVINRTVVKAQDLAKKINANALELQQLPNIINDYSVIILCCHSTLPLLDVELLLPSIKSKQQLLILDLSMPLVTDLHLRKYDNLNIITIDDIAKVVEVGIEKRKYAASKADEIITDKILEYQKWERKRSLSPLIRAMRDSADVIRLEVLSDAQKQILNGGTVDKVLNEFSVKLMNKLIHAPTVNLCVADGCTRDELANLLCNLYNLEIKVEEI